MDPRAYRVAQEFVRAHVRRARYKPEFLQWVQGRKFRNPNPDARKQEVQFDSLPDDEQKKIYRQWAGQRGVTEEAPTARRPETREEINSRNLDIARQGKVVSSEVLSHGGRGGPEEGSPGVNQSSIVKLSHNGQEQMFIHKPAEGEEKHLRVGIPGGTYHAREQAAYQLDRMLGSDGVVPVTATRGDGSYQLWAEGARAMHGSDLDDLVGRVKPEDLHRSPDFERVNVLDLITGHEDRHRGNLLYYFQGEDKTPENLRFVAIDNGLSMASPSELPDHHAYYHPFGAFYLDDETKMEHERQQDADVARHRGNQAVAKSLSSLTPEMQEKLKQVKLGDAAKAMTAAGVDEEGAVRAALTRIVALQADPKIFGEFLKRANNDLEKAWQEFQHSSGSDDLLKRAGATDRQGAIDEALGHARPEQGWTPPEKLDNFFEEAQKELEGFDSWGIFAETAKPDIKTKPEGGAPKRDENKTVKEAVLNVRDRWLSSVVRRTAKRRGMPFRGRP